MKPTTQLDDMMSRYHAWPERYPDRADEIFPEAGEVREAWLAVGDLETDQERDEAASDVLARYADHFARYCVPASDDDEASALVRRTLVPVWKLIHEQTDEIARLKRMLVQLGFDPETGDLR
jgi:hypothetical protein